ncbi:MAG: hypothetical protein ACRCT2_14645, partial [Plesiomonas shigelloides]
MWAQAPHSVPGAGKNVFSFHYVKTGSVLTPAQPTAVMADTLIKHKHLKKKSNFPLSAEVKPPKGGLPPKCIQPLAIRAETW